MPRIFDNIELKLLSELKQTLAESTRADFCVGYFNLRGWRPLADSIDRFAGDMQSCCRLLVGMQRPPEDELRIAYSLASNGDGLDNQAATRLRKRMAEEFRNQLMIGAPSNADEAALRKLSAQIRAGRVVVKLFLAYPLHAKLYLLHRHDKITPLVGYLGSSNLTFAGLSRQGELNVDITDQDAAKKLQAWFDNRWSDRWCIDISNELANIIDTSWARDQPLSPYLVYLKIAYHLSQEARAGLNEFRIPRDFGDQLFDFQKAAVKIAAHHLNKRGGVVIGDVVGLGKTLMATALSRVFQDDHGTETLIICPKNLEPMWRDYVDRYRVIGRVLPITRALSELADLRRYRVVLIDESHNLRNSEGKTYRAIREYIRENESRCILLSATPYNKTYLDLSAQLALFVPPDEDLGIRPEQKLRDMGETEFIARHQCNVRTLKAFEFSEFPDDWRDLMRRYLVRRTRGFIKANYAETDDRERPYLPMTDGERFYFPVRVPKTVRFVLDEQNPADPYGRLFAPAVVDAIDRLRLPRYGLGNYIAATAAKIANPSEKQILDGLSRAGQRLMGFSRTNLFKRLESSGPAFLQSVERHILRNFIFTHAIENDRELPLGSQGAELLDNRSSDGDETIPSLLDGLEDEETVDIEAKRLPTESDYRREAAEVYNHYLKTRRRGFKWIRSSLFEQRLADDLLADTRILIGVLDACGFWQAATDAKLNALADLMTRQHPNEKILVFSQFADTVDYLAEQLKKRGITSLAGVTGNAADPTSFSWRFSPVSNAKQEYARQQGELRLLIATDVLSEGQNLQDCAIIVNYDLPWAIIRLIQRAGRVDRIGQKAETIRCYSFIPADGIERIINLRGRVRRRLQENAEVVGADEVFFEDDAQDQPLLDLYSEKAGILDGEEETEVDLASLAYQIWKNAIDADPKLEKVVADLPDVIYATRGHHATPGAPQGVLLYLRTADDNDALAWIDEHGQSITESQLTILNAASCHPQTPGLPRDPRHHELVLQGVTHLVKEENRIGGQLGRPSGARFRTYERLKSYTDSLRKPGILPLFGPNLDELGRAVEEIYRAPLREAARESLNRMLRSGADDETLAKRVVELRAADQLTQSVDTVEIREPRIICSLGLFTPNDATENQIDGDRQ